jgi:hypothetical protein
LRWQKRAVGCASPTTGTSLCPSGCHSLKNLRSNMPGRRFPGLCLEPLKLTFQPGGMAFDKLSRHFRRAAAGDCDAGGAIVTQAEQIAAGARIAHHQERQRLRPHRQMNDRRSRWRPGSENPFKQHGVVNRGLAELAMVVATLAQFCTAAGSLTPPLSSMRRGRPVVSRS